MGLFAAPSETILSPIFSTRHTPTGHLTNVDNEVVQYFGYLPQDMLGCSIFNYYHPMDFPLIKDIYKTVSTWTLVIRNTMSMKLKNNNEDKIKINLKNIIFHKTR